MADRVSFFANGPARLLMSCIIADEFYPDKRRTLILLDQFGYDYGRLLPHVGASFDRILFVKGRERRYSNLAQIVGTYIRPYIDLSDAFSPGEHSILFGLRSPIQKHIIRRNRELGNSIDIYAESIAVDRYFDNGFDTEPVLRSLARGMMARALDYQHDYDRFFLHVPQLYLDSPQAPKFRKMPRLFQMPSAEKYADIMLRDIDLSGLAGYDTVFFGQPLSNFDGLITPEAEEDMLRQILGDRKVVVMPHPNERLDVHNKYAVLPNARILPAGLPNDLICQRLKPRRTITYSSTIGIDYALSQPNTENLFFPVLARSLHALERYARHVSNIEVSDRYVTIDAG